MKHWMIAMVACLGFLAVKGQWVTDKKSLKSSISSVLKGQILKEADWAMQQEPITVTANYSKRSSGGVHDFFSEGDYWWPNPQSPDSPYIQRDGMTNPENFTAHRLSMIRLSRIVGALASAYMLTGDSKYVEQAMKHCKAWFIQSETMMNPSLLYAQAIKGRFTGRGIGIIDTIQLLEVVQGLMVMMDSTAMHTNELNGIKSWFERYLQWLMTHPYGKDEMNAENNHGTCWVMQVAAFAKFTGNQQVLDFCVDRFKNKLLPGQVEPNGSMPRELKRTKPFGYSLFNLDAFCTIAQILSDGKNDLWHFETADGRSIQKAVAYLFGYVKDKSTWPFAKDVMYWDQWPVAQPFLLFAGNAYQEMDYCKVWEKLEHAPTVEEVLRNLPVRHPLIWFH